MAESKRTYAQKEQTYAVELAQLPKLSIGALFMPPIWGPAHGIWATIFFYPLWIFADSCFMAAYKQGGIAILFAVLVGLGTALVTVWFAVTSQKPAYLRVADRVSIEVYLRRERIWAIVSIAIALILLFAATYFNLFLYDAVHGAAS